MSPVWTAHDERWILPTPMEGGRWPPLNTPGRDSDQVGQGAVASTFLIWSADRAAIWRRGRSARRFCGG